MKLTRIAALTFATLCIATSACRSTAPQGFGSADRAALNALEASFTRMLSTGDSAGLTTHYYSADAVVMPPNEPSAVGSHAIAKLFSTWPPVKDVVLTKCEIYGCGDVAYSTGTYSMTLLPPGAAPIHDKGKFLDIARRQNDGSWKVTRDIFNSDLPAAGN